MTQMLIFRDKAELLSKAEETANGADEVFRKATKLYYIVRYFTAVYESQNGKVLIQIWNEYRNAIDHFFRFQSSDKTSAESLGQLKKMEGHLQRAAFDILKLNSHIAIENLQKFKVDYPIEALRLVDNGNFLPNLDKEISKITQLFTAAKISDHELGTSDDNDESVLEQYLEAAIQAHIANYDLNAKRSDIERAHNTHNNITSTGMKLSIAQSLGISFIMLILATILAPITAPYVTEARSWMASSNSEPTQTADSDIQENTCSDMQDGTNTEVVPEPKAVVDQDAF
ncbi:MAG: hypothetical protein ACI9C9_002679 [Marivirga sp.]|jgi:hypothetical protein